MQVKSFLVKIKNKILRKENINYNSVEYLKSRGVRIGKNVNLYNTNIDFGHGFLVEIGNNVTLTGVTVLAHDASTQIPLGVSKVGRVMIGNNVFVGHGSIILPNTRIGNNCVIGAGTVVSKDIPDNTVAVGNPVQFIGTYDQFVEKHKKMLETKPRYNKLWKDKSDSEKEQMWNDLEKSHGYDL